MYFLKQDLKQKQPIFRMNLEEYREENPDTQVGDPGPLQVKYKIVWNLFFNLMFLDFYCIKKYSFVFTRTFQRHPLYTGSPKL